MIKQPKYFFWQSIADKLWYFHLVGGNGEIQHPSEGYKTKQGAIKGIKKVQKNSPIATIHELK